MTDLKVRARDDQLIRRRFPRVSHWPGIDEAELVSASAAGAEFGDSVVEAIDDVDRVFRAKLGEAQEENDRLIVYETVY